MLPSERLELRVGGKHRMICSHHLCQSTGGPWIVCVKSLPPQPPARPSLASVNSTALRAESFPRRALPRRPPGRFEVGLLQVLSALSTRRLAHCDMPLPLAASRRLPFACQCRSNFSTALNAASCPASREHGPEAAPGRTEDPHSVALASVGRKQHPPAAVRPVPGLLQGIWLWRISLDPFCLPVVSSCLYLLVPCHFKLRPGKPQLSSEHSTVSLLLASVPLWEPDL
jgi:hypothetical protein